MIVVFIKCFTTRVEMGHINTVLTQVVNVSPFHGNCFITQRWDFSLVDTYNTFIAHVTTKTIIIYVYSTQVYSGSIIHLTFFSVCSFIVIYLIFCVQKVARLESTLHRISSKPKEGVRNKHILFVDSDEEMEEVIANYSNERDLPKHQQAEESKEEIKKIQSTQYKELKQRRHRQRQLAMIAAKMQTKKNLQVSKVY